MTNPGTFDPAAFASGTELISRFIQGAQAVGLLQAALECGLLGAAGAPATPDTLASRIGVSARMVHEACIALHALEIFEKQGDYYQIRPGVQALLHQAAPQTLANMLAHGETNMGLLRRALHPNPSPLPEERLAVARGVWGLGSSPVAIESFLTVDREMPEIRELWLRGARHMELGCGAGRDLLRVAAPYPATFVVGVDIDPLVLAEVERQARDLGIQDRVAVRLADAREIEDLAAFDTILWSQMFFPPASRAATIDAIRRALKPGGYLITPLLRDRPASDEALRSAGGRQTSLGAVIYASWGLDRLTESEVREELEAAGFSCIRTVPHSRTPFMLLRHEASRVFG
ncbi:class I SAM-dependent methyltransferase [Roseomonas sp. HF4]|uniref:class I SAM-dependent methyltransferase n=1 Tax=Roseomonas sp. HF4 TaxID=2562313 RepID=UPI0010C0F6C2|nr:class I SAM-dependent methyltransferase [Roseomonas sp. HF4]